MGTKTQPPANRLGYGGEDVSQTRAADDFATIKAHLEELRRERERPERVEKGLPSDPPSPRDRTGAVAIAIRGLRDAAEPHSP